MDGLRANGIAGCVLTYCYLNCMANGAKQFDISMLKNIPEFVLLVGDQDVWQFVYGDETRLMNNLVNVGCLAKTYE